MIRYRSMLWVMSKSAITPSFIGLMAMILPGVRPIICLASSPTASTSPVSRWIATTDGSMMMMPLPFTCTRVLAVPRSIPTSLVKNTSLAPSLDFSPALSVLGNESHPAPRMHARGSSRIVQITALSLRLVKTWSPIIIWSRTSMPINFPASARRRVISRSSPLGVASPLGWL